MTRAPHATDGDRPGRQARVCTACSLLCDDVVPDGDVLTNACATGRTAWRESLAAVPAATPAWWDGRPVSFEEGLDRAAALVAGARRPLVTGLCDATLDAILAACDLAEACGAAIDFGDADAATPCGPVVARVGRVTADWDELRDRADLVVLWWCDPDASHPRFLERFVLPPPRAGARRTIAVGPCAVLPPGAGHVHVSLDAVEAVTAARALHALVSGGPAAAAVPAGLASRLEPVRLAIETAKTIAFVTGGTDDVTGLDAWSTAALVRALAASRPAFEVPLPHGATRGANAAGAAAVCGWRYGASGAIPLADRAAAAFRPGEADACRLVSRREVDCVVAVGALPEPVETALSRHAADLPVVRLTTGPGSRPERGVVLPTRPPLLVPSGAMLRGDGRWVNLGDESTPRPDPLRDVVHAILARITTDIPRVSRREVSA